MSNKESDEELEAYPRQKETYWIAQHPEILAQYHERWIAVVGEQVVASGYDLTEVLEAAKSFAPDPLLFLVPPAGILVH